MASLYLPLIMLLVPIILLLVLTIIVRPRSVKIPIKGRHVFFTGGSSSIGLALAQQVASQGARVSILARSLESLVEARNSIRIATGIQVAIFSADVINFEEVQKAINEAGPVDILVCTQGIFLPEVLETQDLKTIKSMIDVNLMGTFHLIKAALPGMKNRRDRGPASIALMSSQAGQVGFYGQTAYSASKYGLRGLAEALQQEVISDNIHVSLIFPPDTTTPGLVEDQRPEVTSIIEGPSVFLTADEVAQIALNGIKSGSFIVPCNFMGVFLSIATAGLSPQRSAMMALIEVLGAGVSRLAGLFFQWGFYEA